MRILRQRMFTRADKKAIEELINATGNFKHTPKGFFTKLIKGESSQADLDKTTQLLANLTHYRNTTGAVRAAGKSYGANEEQMRKLLDKLNSSPENYKENLEAAKRFLRDNGLHATSDDLEHLLRKEYDPVLLERWAKIRKYKNQGLKPEREQMESLRSELVKNQHEMTKMRNTIAAADGAGKIPLESERSKEIMSNLKGKKFKFEDTDGGSEFIPINGGDGGTVYVNKTRKTLPTYLHENYHGNHFLNEGSNDTIIGQNIVRNKHKVGSAEKAMGLKYTDKKTGAVIENGLKNNKEELSALRNLSQESHATGDGLRAGLDAGMSNEEMARGLKELGPAYNHYFNGAVIRGIDSKLEYLGHVRRTV